MRNYTIKHNADGTVTVTDKAGKDGTDTLENIEKLQFPDRSILVDDGLGFKEQSSAEAVSVDPIAQDSVADFESAESGSVDAPIAGVAGDEVFAPDPSHTESSPQPLSFGASDAILTYRKQMELLRHPQEQLHLHGRLG